MVQEGISSLDKNNLLNALRSKQESVCRKRINYTLRVVHEAFFTRNYQNRIFLA